MRISRNLDAKIRIKANDTMVKEVDKLVYLESEINSEGKLAEISTEKYKIALNSIKL
jgi:hypothetical protein